MIPNMGKSALITSLRQSRAVSAGATRGVTRSTEEVHLDKDIGLIYCPGTVISWDTVVAYNNSVYTENEK